MGADEKYYSTREKHSEGHRQPHHLHHHHLLRWQGHKEEDTCLKTPLIPFPVTMQQSFSYFPSVSLFLLYFFISKLTLKSTYAISYGPYE